MHSRAWLVCATYLICCALVGCTDKNDDLRNDTSSTGAAAVALTKAVVFENGELVSGLMPPSTTEDPTLVPLTGDPVSPGGDALMAFDLDGPIGDGGDLVALVQFDGAGDHFSIEAPVTGGSADGGVGEGGHVELSYAIDSDVCKELCAKTYAIKVKQAVKLKSGEITEHVTGTITLDCTDDGDPDLCPKKNTGSSMPANKDAAALVDAFFVISTSICECSADSSGCPMDENRDCIVAAVDAHFDELGEQPACMATYLAEQQDCIDTAKCDTATLTACDFVAKSSMGLDPVAEACGELPAALQTETDACGGKSGEFTCADGTMSIAQGSRCDGAPDCDDGSDEVGCGSSIDAGFTCSDGSQIASDQLCDGAYDCVDQVDEQVCAPCGAIASEIVSSFQLCDGIDDCSNAYDESFCDFTCEDGGTVPTSVVCNTVAECADGSDELGCSEQLFACGDKDQTSVPFTDVCDGVAECPNSYDEVQCQ